MITDCAHLLRLMEHGSIPKHLEGGWKIEEPDRETGKAVLVDVSSFAISQARRLEYVDVVKTDEGYIGQLRNAHFDSMDPDLAALDDDLTHLKDPARLEALAKSGLMGSGPEEKYDRLTRLACAVLKAPISLFTVVSEREVYFKSQFGLDGSAAEKRTIPFNDSICKYVVSSGKKLVLFNAHENSHAQHSAIMGSLHTTAYVGGPIKSSQEMSLGAFAVVDHVARHWTRHELDLLFDLAGTVNELVRANEERGYALIA